MTRVDGDDGRKLLCVLVAPKQPAGLAQVAVTVCQNSLSVDTYPPSDALACNKLNTPGSKNGFLSRVKSPVEFPRGLTHMS